jgi:hypothetical protein
MIERGKNINLEINEEDLACFKCDNNYSDLTPEEREEIFNTSYVVEPLDFKIHECVCDTRQVLDRGCICNGC